MWIKLFITLLISLPAWGYKLTQDFSNGFYWQNLPLKITVLEKDADLRNTLQQLAEDAVGEWEARTGLSLWSLDDTASTNVIRWSNNFAAETKMDPMTVLAVAIRYTSGPYFARAEIVINGGHPLNSDFSHLLTTITHELGHTMGLDHSDNPWAVMAPTLQDPYRGLHRDDIEGMSAAYDQTKHRQATRYVSPLAYEKEETSEALSCGTVSTNAAQASHGLLSLGAGMLIGMLRKVIAWFKSKL